MAISASKESDHETILDEIRSLKTAVTRSHQSGVVKARKELKELNNRIRKLEIERVALRTIISETLWMARRYAHGRSTYAPYAVNRQIDTALSLGIKILPDEAMDIPSLYADDGMLGRWSPVMQSFRK
jgi:hypothetical protein